MGLTYRLAQLTITEREFLQGQSNARSLRMVALPVSRGMIYDRNGLPLAASTMLKSLWIDPSEVDLQPLLDSGLADLVQMSKKSLADKVKQNAQKEFVYVKRHMDPSIETSIRELGLSGVGLQKEFKRYYPDSESVAQLVGRTNIDEKGVEGLELAYDSWLKGEPGKERVTKDRLGRIIAKGQTVVPAKEGNDLYLSIDKKDQAVVYEALAEGVKAAGAKSGSAVVLDAKTGEVLAVTNYPSYNPNDTHRIDPERVRNRAITDLFEPGSTVKPLSMLAALNQGKHHVDDTIDIGKGHMTLEGHDISDVHHSDSSEISLTDILVYSSNVGIAKLVLEMPVSTYLAELANFGFGQSTGSGFPGEPSGMIADSIRQGSFDQASLSYGYGASMTLLQLSQAYLHLASCGAVKHVQLLRDDSPHTDTPSSVEHCKAVHQMMSRVVSPGGTGARAAVKGYQVAGKTGTSYIASNKGYDTNRYIASFAGFAPAEAPQYVVAVALWEPDYEHHFGGRSAAPIFAQIMQHLLVFKGAPTERDTQSSRRYN
jgi:cell division protein FtsI (penicillin-binding protein 3)